ncbi:hypothetical protein UlMin_026185 [Ulmus minor]
MANPPRTRKRVRAIPRAPDGSAFQKCHKCGVSVAIAWVDMHECEPAKDVKRFKGICKRGNVQEESFSKQPRSPFCLFMEQFKTTCESGNSIDIDRKGFAAWKNMSNEAREPYVTKAKRVNLAYQKTLLEEEERCMWKVHEEVDSAMVEKFDPILEDYMYKFHENSDTSDGWHSYVDDKNYALSNSKQFSFHLFIILCYSHCRTRLKEKKIKLFGNKMHILT